MPHLREDQAVIHCHIQGIPLPLTTPWQSLSGGDVEAESRNVTPGGMLNAIAIGGPAKRTDCTIKRLYGSTLTGDNLHNYLNQLDQAVGKVRMSISWTPLDADGNVVGRTFTITGILKSCTHPTWDAEASNPATLQLVCDCDLQAQES